MADRLSRKQFDAEARRALSEVLGSHGFDCAASEGSTFYREASAGLFHIVLLDPLARLPKFDVRVFPHSPLLEGDGWAEKFPDSLGIPTGSLSYLHSRNGVGPDQELFFCKSTEVFLQDFGARVKPALLRFALPYLDRIRSVSAIGELKGLHPVYAERLRALREV